MVRFVLWFVLYFTWLLVLVWFVELIWVCCYFGGIVYDLALV